MRMVEIDDGVHVALARRTTGESAAARSLLRHLLIEVAEDTPVAKRPSGQPFLPERPDLGVSLSHSGDWVAAAVGPAAVGLGVGVDVQVPEPVPAGLLRRCCSPATRAVLARMPGRDREFAWIWTAQEACVKATGQGLAGLPWLIPVEAGQRMGTWRGIRWLSLRDSFPVPVSCAYGGES
jgi:4'-phosphopantetheinyl transferase